MLLQLRGTGAKSPFGKSGFFWGNTKKALADQAQGPSWISFGFIFRFRGNLKHKISLSPGISAKIAPFYGVCYQILIG
jgi:hypothetical protein